MQLCNVNPFSFYPFFCPLNLIIFNVGSIDIPDNTWMYKVNIGANGFYQVNYDENNWKILLSQIRKKHTVRFLFLFS